MPQSKNKILIIEDEDILLDVLQKKLTHVGYEVGYAKDGLQGVEKIKNWEPDLILLDIMMPKMNGYEVLEEMKKMKKTAIPVIIISNSGQPVEIEKAKSLGAEDYLVKAEFDPDEVIYKVEKLLKKQNNASTEKSQRNLNSKALSNGKTKVLVVEDDQFLRELIVRKLVKEGFKVAIAIDGQEGLQKIFQELPDLVLLDIILPGMDGFEILKQAKSHSDQKIKNIPIILLSNLGQESDIEKGQKLGADDYLIKAEFTTDEIVNKIKKSLKK